MKTIYSKHFLSIASTLIAGMVMAQPVNNSTMPFKEIHRKQCTDNFTAWEIKKKELEIAPSQIVFLNTAAILPIKEDKYRQKKKAGSN
jgi:hypothetical protein